MQTEDVGGVLCKVGIPRFGSVECRYLSQCYAMLRSAARYPVHGTGYYYLVIGGNQWYWYGTVLSEVAKGN